MNSLVLRVISAAVAIVLMVGVWLTFGAEGIATACGVIVLLGQMEYSNMAFRSISSRLRFQILYLFLCLGAFICTMMGVHEALLAFGLLATTFVAFLLWMSRSQPFDSEALFRYQSAGLLGLIYCGVLPGCVTRLLFLDFGITWFGTFLAVVFVGDTAAFFAGSYLGKGGAKLYEAVSPKKTIRGSVFGFIGSAVVGMVCLKVFLPEVPIWFSFIACLLTAFFAQTGDLFESLIKRMAQVKDSGKLMPGHGGILDRVDGVYFSGPTFLFFAYFAEKLFWS